jgi:hypothetical protein
MKSTDAEILKTSIVIAAHPDDEVLWFGSLLENVKEVIVCFLDCKSKPQWGDGRKKSIDEYPLKKISCLGVGESEVFECADWRDPVATKYGLAISTESVSYKLYRKNYIKLEKYLKSKLKGYDNVFTHNPWGEYGHEEHVQVYRVVKKLQEEMGFNLWFPSVCSNRSFRLMATYVDTLNSESLIFKTDKKMSNEIKSLYQKNGCWTWYQDWEWFDEEAFVKDTDIEEGIQKYGKSFPLNFIKVRTLNGSQDRSADRGFLNYKKRIFTILGSRVKKRLSRYFKKP